MGFFDDLQNVAESVASKASSDVGSFISTKLDNALIKKGPAPTGNLSQAQLDQGKTGSIAGSANAAIHSPVAKYVAIGAAILAGFALMKRGRR